MTSLSTALLVCLAYLLGRRDRRITHEPPRTVQPSLRRRNEWRSERLVREVGNRRRS